MNDPRAVGAQIRMRLPSLTPLEGKVAADILARRDITEETSLREVAEGSRVSDAMVVKVAKKLGFDGFRDFRQGLIGYYGSDTAALHSEISVDDTAGEVVQKTSSESVYVSGDRSGGSMREGRTRQLLSSCPRR